METRAVVAILRKSIKKEFVKSRKKEFRTAADSDYERGLIFCSGILQGYLDTGHIGDKDIHQVK